MFSISIRVFSVTGAAYLHGTVTKVSVDFLNKLPVNYSENWLKETSKALLCLYHIFHWRNQCSFPVVKTVNVLEKKYLSYTDNHLIFGSLEVKYTWPHKGFSLYSLVQLSTCNNIISSQANEYIQRGLVHFRRNLTEIKIRNMSQNYFTTFLFGGMNKYKINTTCKNRKVCS